jgi:hypothetical protein
MKTTVWIHEDVLDHFKEHIIAYAKKMGFVGYTEQQIFVDQYLQAYRMIVDKYERRGLTDSHILSIKDEYEHILLKNDLLEEFKFFVVPKHLSPVFQQPRIDMGHAFRILGYLKGDTIIENNNISSWIGYHKRNISRTLRMEIKE